MKASAKLLTNALKKTLSAFDLPDQGSGVYTRTSYNKEVKHRGDKSKTESESESEAESEAESEVRRMVGHGDKQRRLD